MIGDKHASAVQVLTWFLLVTSMLGVGARGITKAVIVRSVSLDDYLITISLVWSCVSPILTYPPKCKIVIRHWTISHRLDRGWTWLW